MYPFCILDCKLTEGRFFFSLVDYGILHIVKTPFLSFFPTPSGGTPPNCKHKHNRNNKLKLAEGKKK